MLGDLGLFLLLRFLLHILVDKLDDLGRLEDCLEDLLELGVNPILSGPDIVGLEQLGDGLDRVYDGVLRQHLPQLDHLLAVQHLVGGGGAYLDLDVKLSLQRDDVHRPEQPVVALLVLYPHGGVQGQVLAIQGQGVLE